MSSPAEFYNSLPPVTRAYATVCVLFTTTVTLGLLDLYYIALLHKQAFLHFQVWRLVTNFFFLGKFSINFGIRLLMILRYGVQLEKGPFDRRTADFLWMMIFGSLSLLVLSAIPIFQSYFLGVSLVFMLVYVWSREFPNAQINIYGLVTLKAFYLPWAMLGLDVIFGSPIVPDLLGIIAGHLYYFLTVLHPLATGKYYLKTPKWVYPNYSWFLYMKMATIVWFHIELCKARYPSFCTCIFFLNASCLLKHVFAVIFLACLCYSPPIMVVSCSPFLSKSCICISFRVHAVSLTVL